MLWLLLLVFGWLTFKLEQHRIVAAIVLIILIWLIAHDLSQNPAS